MPSELAPEPAHPGVRVVVAPVVELGFCLFIVEKAARATNRGYWQQPWVEPFFESHPGLVERVRTFWEDGAPWEWGELPLLANAAGVIFESDPARAWPAIERTAARGMRVPPLPAEEPGVDALLQARIDQLAADPERRAAYMALLHDMWTALQPQWESVGRATAMQLAEQVRDQLGRQSDPLTVLPTNHFARRSGCGEAVGDSIERGTFVIVPLGLGGVGYAFFVFPDLALAAFGPDSEKRVRHRREEAEQAAAQYKLLSDPTRNQILASLIQLPQSITELAQAFQLSQPTVSVHIKMLRQAGLLESVKVKGQTQYSAPIERLREHLRDAELLLTAGCE